MRQEKPTILVFGATGRQGGAVAKALLDRGWPVRALVRDPLSENAVVLRQAGADIVQGTFAEIDTLRAAMRDAYGVFSVLPGYLEEQEEVKTGCMIADLAAETGISHLVYSSGASSGDKPTGVARFDAKPRVEAHIRSLPLNATIVRPMIFMEMLLAPVFGLNEGRYTFLLRPEQSMQLVAVEDIGKFVTAIFCDRPRFSGKTIKLASDTVTGDGLAAIFSEAAGKPIAYSRFGDDVLAANDALGSLAKILDDGPLAEHVDLDAMRNINPDILSFRSWLATSGKKAFQAAIGTGGISEK
ncbi:NmrA/HSCARG family protein [Rhizobium wenxiniae]|uniref:NmrA/HSCARG family protein n=1 Tax=Rhizobium wenxiniae TaxID=1737357 RepID=UPI001C6F1C2D|nr:NmrA/HSCARG family protein [Rhizobium wenxiniae]MBW9089196.1 NmrA/HSCARG family protein [Rhizobium wenxiniae]